MNNNEIREQLQRQVEQGEITPAEMEARLTQHERNTSATSHLERKFADESTRSGKQLLADDDYIAQHRNDKQRARRVVGMQEVVGEALAATTMQNRVTGAFGPGIKKVNWGEFVKMAADPEFKRLAQYFPTLVYYCGANGLPDVNKPRPHAVRPLLQNEVGMYKDMIIVLADAGPGDHGEGKYHVVGEQLEKAR